MTPAAFRGKATEVAPLPGEEDCLREILARPVARPAGEVTWAIEAGPFDPADALPREQVDRLCDPAPMAVENGWTKLPDGSIQVAFRTALAALTPEMIEWWADWHPLRDQRYRAWHPNEHFGNRNLPGATPGKKSYWGAVIFFDEDVGDGRTQQPVGQSGRGAGGDR